MPKLPKREPGNKWPGFTASPFTKVNNFDHLALAGRTVRFSLDDTFATYYEATLQADGSLEIRVSGNAMPMMLIHPMFANMVQLRVDERRP